MGQSFSKLFCLFCCPPYLPTIVSKLAFIPPTCTYSIIRDTSSTFVINFSEFDIKRGHEKYLHYFEVMSRGDSVSCLYLKTAPLTKNTILFCHGNAVDIGMMASTLIELGLELRVNVITYDYSGYGASSGHPTEAGLYEGIAAVLEHVHLHLDIPHKHIILYGQSIGSVPAIFIATKFRFGVLVLHSPLCSGFRFLPGCYWSLFACCDVLNNMKRAKHIQCPVLLIHGTDDEITHIDHSYDLMRTIPSELLLEPLFIDGAGHNNCESYSDYLIRLRYLIDHELELSQTNFSNTIFDK